MARKKKMLYAVTVTDFAAEGKCLVKHEGQVVFLNSPNVAPGDIVDVLIKRKKSNHSEGVVLKTHAVSEKRIKPFCSHFGVCGGCKWQHIPYAWQLEQKQKQVQDHLERIGKIETSTMESILPSSQTQFYRNKLEFTFSNTKWLTKDEINSEDIINKNALGFHVPKRFDKVIPVDKCYLQPDPSNEIRNFIDAFAKKNDFTYYDHIAHKGFLRSLMIRTSTLNETLLLIQFAENNLESISYLLNELIGNFPSITSLNYVINTKGNDSIYDLNIVNYFGKEHIEEAINDLRFKITPKSFYQTNPVQAVALYEIAKDFSDLKPDDVLYDLYTGTGTIALFMAKWVKKVVGVESVEEAIKDAKINAIENNIENAHFFVGDMKKVFNKEFVQKNEKPDVIIVDPPRAGMDKEVVEMILSLYPERLVYISCNTATQARDLAILEEKYKIVKIQPVDMFPHTHHVENVVKLIRKS